MNNYAIVHFAKRARPHLLAQGLKLDGTDAAADISDACLRYVSSRSGHHDIVAHWVSTGIDVRDQVEPEEMAERLCEVFL